MMANGGGVMGTRERLIATLLDVGKADLGPLRKIVGLRFLARWVTEYRLERGHAKAVRGDKTPKRLRCLECRKRRQHADEVPRRT